MDKTIKCPVLKPIGENPIIFKKTLTEISSEEYFNEGRYKNEEVEICKAVVIMALLKVLNME